MTVRLAWNFRCSTAFGTRLQDRPHTLRQLKPRCAALTTPSEWRPRSRKRSSLPPPLFKKKTLVGKKASELPSLRMCFPNSVGSSFGGHVPDCLHHIHRQDLQNLLHLLLPLRYVVTTRLKTHGVRKF